MFHIILGKRWRQRMVRLKNQWGWCDYDKQELRIAKGQSGVRLAETLIHEASHAAFRFMDEETVTAFGRDMARILDRNGLLVKGDE